MPGLLSVVLLPAPVLAMWIDHGNGTVRDTATGLVWDQCSVGQTWHVGTGCTGTASVFAWGAALTQLAALNGGRHRAYDDWRLPNVNELETLVDLTRSAPATDTSVFAATASTPYWTSTSFQNVPQNAWYVDFDQGAIGTAPKDMATYPVRLVRGGENFAAFNMFSVAPTLSGVSASDTTQTSTTLHATSNTTATGYWVAVLRDTASPTAAEIRAGEVHGGSAAALTGHATMLPGVAHNFAIAGLTQHTSYALYLVAEDGSGNLSAPARVDITTEKTPVHGTCGHSAGNPSSAIPWRFLCSAGIATTAIAGVGGQWSWGCNGSTDGSSTASDACTAPYAGQALTISASPTRIAIGGRSSITASSSANLPVTLSASGPCTLAGTVITGTGVGTCTITANQGGTGDSGSQRFVAAQEQAVHIAVADDFIPSGPGPSGAVPIPALSAWALIVLSALLGGLMRQRCTT